MSALRQAAEKDFLTSVYRVPVSGFTKTYSASLALSRSSKRAVRTIGSIGTERSVFCFCFLKVMVLRSTSTLAQRSFSNSPRARSGVDSHSDKRLQIPALVRHFSKQSIFLLKG